ncbi:protein kinase domain-containing protein [Nonomuraea jabiensis]|uniref:Protein kinase domain-containing protein n=1 Tax=Nonomuraea jabiensis TaxID=882448 RepID=A0A7W9FY38_9ACTN|nr:serine/threonine protein kinase [Nonomuraea jabiensis]MBB5773677.1 hypothetical protein [Nonomuraea jabiensis]
MTMTVEHLPEYVRDEHGNTYQLDRETPIGEGGQGVVLRVKRSRLAVKICFDDGQPSLGDDIRERLDRLRWLPIEDLPVSRPIVRLDEPHVGYVMELLEDMASMESLCQPPAGDLGPWYARGGGLSRRLRLLAKCADVLGRMHGRGIVYGDVSPGNILVSADPEHDEVWLVDADNLRVESSPADRVVKTPFYAAPELLRRLSGNTPFSDAYSFATIAYETLVANHPLLGDLVEDGPVEYQEDVQRGLLPWVGHSDDDRNRSSHGLEPGLVLTKRLRALFEQTFEEGVRTPYRRPGLHTWADALHAAADLTIVCPSCRQTYYAFCTFCPWCRAEPPQIVVVQAHDVLPAGFADRAQHLAPRTEYLVLQGGQPVNVTARLTRVLGGDAHTSVARLTWNGAYDVTVRNVGTTAMRRVPAAGGAGRMVFPGSEFVEDVRMPWFLHFGEDSRVHRALTFMLPRRSEG